MNLIHRLTKALKSRRFGPGRLDEAIPSDAFEKEYMKAPFIDPVNFIEGRWYGPSNRITDNLSRQIFERARKLGMKFPEQLVKELGELSDRWAAIQTRMGQLGFLSASGIYTQRKLAYQQDHIEGHRPPTPDLNFDSITTNIGTERAACRETLAAISKEINALMLPAAEYVILAARQIAVGTVEKEHEVADTYGIPFFPSQPLKDLVAYCVWAPLSLLDLGTTFPSKEWFQPTGCPWARLPEFAEISARTYTARANVISEKERRAATAASLANAEANLRAHLRPACINEESPAERATTLVAINALNDAIREGRPVTEEMRTAAIQPLRGARQVQIDPTANEAQLIEINAQNDAIRLQAKP